MDPKIINKIFLDNISLIGVFLVVAGLVKVFTYYKLFGISIFSFIKLQEVITLFVNNLLAYGILLSFICTIFIFSDKLSNQWLLILPISFTVAVLIYYLTKKHIYFYEFILISLTVWLIFICVKLVFLEKRLMVLNIEDYKYTFLPILLISLIIFSIAAGINEHFKVKRKKYYSKTTIDFEGSQFIPSTKKYFIGKTEGFIFIHDEVSNSTEVIPITELKKIKFIK